MIEVLIQTFQENREDYLETLRANEIIISREDSCLSLTWKRITYHQLLGNHEEADTNVIAHAYETLQVSFFLNDKFKFSS